MIGNSGSKIGNVGSASSTILDGNSSLTSGGIKTSGASQVIKTSGTSGNIFKNQERTYKVGGTVYTVSGHQNNLQVNGKLYKWKEKIKIFEFIEMVWY